MAVKIRLARRGRKKLAMYDVVVADARAPRDGRFIEKLGNYNPNSDPAFIDINDERAFQWVMEGAQPTDTVRALLSYRGIMYRKHLQVGVNKGAITQEAADKKLTQWLEEKRAQIQNKIDKLSKEETSAAQKRREAELKVNEARIEKIKQKSADLAAAAVAAAAKAAGETEEASEDDAAVEAAAETEAPSEEPAAVAEETAPVEETKVEETPATKESASEDVETPKAEEAAPVEEKKVEAAPAAEESKPEEAPVAEAEPAAEEPAVEEKKPAEEAKAEETPVAEEKSEEGEAEEKTDK